MGPRVTDGVGVLGVDDQAIFLEAAREVVGATPGFRWLGGARSGEEALDAVAQLAPQLVVMDVRMPRMDGIEAARRISQAHPEVLVVLISVDESPAICAAIDASGAAELLRKREFGPAMLRRVWQSHRS